MGVQHPLTPPPIYLKLFKNARLTIYALPCRSSRSCGAPTSCCPPSTPSTLRPPRRNLAWLMTRAPGSMWIRRPFGAASSAFRASSTWWTLGLTPQVNQMSLPCQFSNFRAPAAHCWYLWCCMSGFRSWQLDMRNFCFLSWPSATLLFVCCITYPTSPSGVAWRQ